ncbi:MAG: hypothetical protein IJN76_03735 [Clostridia bacterium]|nr:hypothetical protein [Clostridia bacterium]
MYCVKCGVKLADTEKRCPLCNTVVCHPDFVQEADRPLYPGDKLPQANAGTKALNGVILILFLIPLLVCLNADGFWDGSIEWFGYVAGALALAYVAFALPLWFQKPHPVILVPCNFAAVAGYLWYIQYATDGHWFWSFALPVVAGIGAITCAVVTLLCCLRKGKLYIFGGACMALGAFMPLVEFLMNLTFGLSFIGWSIYPLVVLFLFGGLLIYLAINSAAREILERKLFF